MDLTKSLKSILILDLDGKKVLSRTFDESVDEKKYEKKLYISTKSHRTKDEILVIDQTLVFHQFITDLHFYVIGGKNENPIILDSVLECFIEVITNLTNKQVEKQTVLNNLSKIILALDEICENGIILETDANLIMQRVCLKDDAIEQTMAQKLQAVASEQLKFSWMRSYS